jgi:Ca2+-binding RTX toxin-like protein
MTNVTTTGNISTILSLNHSIFDDSGAILGSYFGNTFSNGVDDVLTGNVTLNSFSNTRIDCYAIGAGGNLILNGTGFAGNSGTISKIDFSNGSGGWTLNGSLKWNQYGITGGTVSSISIQNTSSGHSYSEFLSGSFRVTDVGLIGTASSIRVAYDSYTIEYKGAVIYDGSDTARGTISQIKIYDNSGNNILINGSFSASQISLLDSSTTTINEALNAPSLFIGNDVLTVPDAAKEWRGYEGNDQITGGLNGDIFYGDNGDDKLYGLGGADKLHGGAGNDLLDGGSGADELYGDSGNDTYIIDNALDVVVEDINNGTDLVQSSISYLLGNNLENLTLTGTDNINGTGNGLANIIIGNSGANTLDGGLGADTMKGGKGNDLYIVDNVSDFIVEDVNSGADSVNSSVSYSLSQNLEHLTLVGTDNVNGTGNGLANIIIGNSGANTLKGEGGNDVMAAGDGDDTLDGGVGADVMVGGLGNDIYYVDNAGDVVTEVSGQGSSDEVRTALSYTLASEVENLTLLGTAAINGTGNGLDNRLTGNNGANILDGGAGADTMVGGLGNDTYIVDNAGDVVTEGLNGGTDLIKSSVSWVLDENVEKLTLTGASDIDGTGNALANTLTGNSGANVLDGGNGVDVLAGGLGNDTYLVDILKTSKGLLALQDTVTEAANAGADTLKLRASSGLGFATTQTYTLAANLENLDATQVDDSNAINLTGNTLANTIIGNDADNIINGGAGNDTLIGGDGNDTYHLDSTSDVVQEDAGEGQDTVVIAYKNALSTPATLNILSYTNVENITVTGAGLYNLVGDGNDNILIGNSFINTLSAGDGDDTLNGGVGADVMVGGLGDDIYYVDNAGDVITEVSGQGSSDEVRTALSYTLASEVENLTLLGTAAINGTGNGLDNRLTGNNGANILDGGAGADTMVGGLGNDTYIVDNAGDVVTEGLNGGTDLIKSSVSWVLDENVEKLTLTGASDIDGTGNALANTLTGNSGANVLDGGMLLAGRERYYLVDILKTSKGLLALHT